MDGGKIAGMMILKLRKQLLSFEMSAMVCGYRLKAGAVDENVSEGGAGDGENGETKPGLSH